MTTESKELAFMPPKESAMVVFTTANSIDPYLAHIRAEAAEYATKAALVQAEADKQAAIDAERQRVAAEQAQQAAEALRREKDTANKKRVNNEILQDFIAAGLSEECAKTAITAMAKSLVRNVKINY